MWYDEENGLYGMLERDRAGLIRYNDTATVVRGLTGDKDSLKLGINSLSLRYGNNVSLVNQAKEKGVTIHCINVVDGSASAMQRIAENTGGILWSAVPRYFLTYILVAYC